MEAFPFHFFFTPCVCETDREHSLSYLISVHLIFFLPCSIRLLFLLVGLR